jgi:hypothetical protein
MTIFVVDALHIKPKQKHWFVYKLKGKNDGALRGINGDPNSSITGAVFYI